MNRELFNRREDMLMPNCDRDALCRRLDGRSPLAAAKRIVVAGPFHRIAEVRQLQGVSLRAARQALGVSSEEVRLQENENYDLLLSELYRWQQVLDVPVAELLAEPCLQLSQPISKRAALVKVMKTAGSILESAHQSGVQTLARRLIEQLLEVMPELDGVSAWPAVGQRRTMEEYGRIVERPYSVAPPED
jgi:transcriptional regulator with XRE-family HTH domain